MIEPHAITLTLPFPRSLNGHWRHVGGRTLLSKPGREYRRRVAEAILGAGSPRIEGPISVDRLVLHPPDKRARDLDNYEKPLWDALQAAGLFEDDGQIKRLGERVWGEPVKGGAVVVSMSKYAGEPVKWSEHVA